MNASATPELIIFDSDGVLVDSEVIELTVFARIAAEEGVAISVEDAVRSFRGVKMADCVSEVERRLGRGVRDSSSPTCDRQQRWLLMPNWSLSMEFTPRWQRSQVQFAWRRTGRCRSSRMRSH